MNSEGTSEFIDIYRDCACLWDTSSPLYANRNARKTAQEHLLNVMLKYEHTANIASVRKKIDSLRSIFFREHKKVQASESGTGAEDVYVPTWVHYNELSFLSEVQRPVRAGTHSLGTSPPSVSGETANWGDSTENDGDEVEDCVQYAENVEDDFRPPPPKVGCYKRLSVQKQLFAAAPKHPEVAVVESPDKWELFSLSVAADLRTLEDAKQQAIAQKIISDAIFWGKMGRLTEGSSVSLAPSTSVASSWNSVHSKQSPQH